MCECPNENNLSSKLTKKTRGSHIWWHSISLMREKYTLKLNWNTFNH